MLLLRCPKQNAIPIINYNDPVANDEIVKLEIEDLVKKGKQAVHLVDNDETASQVACFAQCSAGYSFTKRLKMLTFLSLIAANILHD